MKKREKKKAVKLRMEERLYKYLKKEIKRTGRSFNAEIIARLDQSIMEPDLFQELLLTIYKHRSNRAKIEKEIANKHNGE